MNVAIKNLCFAVLIVSVASASLLCCCLTGRAQAFASVYSLPVQPQTAGAPRCHPRHSKDNHAKDHSSSCDCEKISGVPGPVAGEFVLDENIRGNPLQNLAVHFIEGVVFEHPQPSCLLALSLSPPGSHALPLYIQDSVLRL